MVLVHCQHSETLSSFKKIISRLIVLKPNKHLKLWLEQIYTIWIWTMPKKDSSRSSDRKPQSSMSIENITKFGIRYNWIFTPLPVDYHGCVSINDRLSADPCGKISGSPRHQTPISVTSLLVSEWHEWTGNARFRDDDEGDEIRWGGWTTSGICSGRITEIASCCKLDRTGHSERRQTNSSILQLSLK